MSGNLYVPINQAISKKNVNTTFQGGAFDQIITD